MTETPQPSELQLMRYLMNELEGEEQKFVEERIALDDEVAGAGLDGGQNEVLLAQGEQGTGNDGKHGEPDHGARPVQVRPGRWYSEVCRS